MSKKSPKAAVAKTTFQPKAAVAKKSGPVSAPEKSVVEEMSEKEEHVYEVVTPRNFLRPDSWSDQSGGNVGKRWWRQKAKKKPALFPSELTGCFYVILIIIIVLIGIGAYYIIKKHREAGSRLDPRLTTKTALCRQYPDVNSKCITEDLLCHQKCSMGATFCRLVRWKFCQNSSRAYLQPEGTSYRINVTEHEDCGHDTDHPEWCINEKCQPTDVHPDYWFRNVPFPNPKGLYISRKIDELSCHEVQHNGSASAFKNLASWYVGDCGHSSCENHCNRSICNANSIIKYGFRVSLLHCDLTMDPTTGSRAYQYYETSPCEMIICYECEKLTAQEKKIRTCAINWRTITVVLFSIAFRFVVVLGSTFVTFVFEMWIWMNEIFGYNRESEESSIIGGADKEEEILRRIKGYEDMISFLMKRSRRSPSTQGDNKEKTLLGVESGRSHDSDEEMQFWTADEIEEEEQLLTADEVDSETETGNKKPKENIGKKDKNFYDEPSEALEL